MKKAISIMKAHYGALIAALVIALGIFITLGSIFLIKNTYTDYNIPSVGMLEVLYFDNDEYGEWNSLQKITKVRYYKLTKNFVIHHKNHDGEMVRVKFSSKQPHSFTYTPDDNWQLEKWTIDGVI